MANPLGSLRVSADPDSPPTVENRTPIGVLLPISENTLAAEYFVMSCVTSKYPNAPAPFAWTTLSGIRSLSKCANSSIRMLSWRRSGPGRPTDNDAALSPTGLPKAVVTDPG